MNWPQIKLTCFVVFAYTCVPEVMSKVSVETHRSPFWGNFTPGCILESHILSLHTSSKEKSAITIIQLQLGSHCPETAALDFEARRSSSLSESLHSGW